MKLHGLPKDWRELARDAQGRGWTLELTRANHVRWRHANGVLISGLTSSDHRAILKHRSLMKKVEAGTLPRLVRFVMFAKATVA